MDGWMDRWMDGWAQPTPSLLGDGFEFLFIAWLACPFFRGGECTRLRCVILRFHEKPTLPRGVMDEGFVWSTVVKRKEKKGAPDPAPT